MVVLGGSGPGITGDADTGAVRAEVKWRYIASEMAPIPHIATASPAQNPINGRLVTTRTAAMPTTTRAEGR